MSAPTLPAEVVASAVRRANRDRPQSTLLSFDFARTFLELLRKKYQKVKTGEEPRTFEELMEDLLDALYCTEREIRSGYKQVAGFVLGELGNEVKARGGPSTRRKKNSRTGDFLRTLRPNGQYALRLPKQKQPPKRS